MRSHAEHGNENKNHSALRALGTIAAKLLSGSPLPASQRQGGNHLSLRSLRLCGECTIFMEQQNLNLTAQVKMFWHFSIVVIISIFLRKAYGLFVPYTTTTPCPVEGRGECAHIKSFWEKRWIS